MDYIPALQDLTKCSRCLAPSTRNFAQDNQFAYRYDIGLAVETSLINTTGINLINIGLAGWAIKCRFRTEKSPLDFLDYFKVAREEFCIDRVEVNNMLLFSGSSIIIFPCLDHKYAIRGRCRGRAP